jgi:hypothetical protein
MPVAAPLIGAAVSIGGSAIAAGSAKSAANHAADLQAQQNAQALALQQKQYDQTRSDLMPWQTAGQSALGQQGNLLGLNGAQGQQSAIDQLKASPLYQSLFRNGQEMVLQNASATGGVRGGNTVGALYDKGNDTLAQVIQSQLANLGGVSSIGQNAAAQVGNFGSNAANQGSALLNNTGAAQGNAAYTVGGANAGLAQSITGSLSGLGSSLFGGGNNSGSTFSPAVSQQMTDQAMSQILHPAIGMSVMPNIGKAF